MWDLKSWLLALLLICALAPIPATAAPIWPSDSLWRPLYSAGGYLPDPDNDYPGAAGNSWFDIEGNSTFPAAYYYVSDQGTADPSDDYLMFRMRIDRTRSPISGAYQFAFDTDGNASTIDWVLQMDTQVDNAVELIPTLVGGPTYGDVTLSTTNAWSGGLTVYGHLLTPALDGSNFGGNSDYFVDVSIPWSVWEANTGIDRYDWFRVALSTSSQHNVINMDFPQALSSSGNVNSGFSDPVAVPEPGTLALLGLSLGALVLKARRRRA